MVDLGGHDEVLLGKVTGVPWRWVDAPAGGACRDHIRIYIGCGGATPEKAAASARERVQQGFRALKTGIGQGPVRIVDSMAFLEGGRA